MDITTNGNDAPPKAETVPITAQLPSGIKCKDNKCLVQFISGSGFGNCIVVQQSGAASTGDPTRNKAAGNSAPFNSTAGGDPASTSTAAGCQANTGSARRSAGVARRGRGSGTLMARLLLADLRNLGEGAVEIAKRDT